MNASEIEVSSPNSLYWLRLLFGRARSRLTGQLMDLPLPPNYREGVLNFWATLQSYDLSEIRYPLSSYLSIGDLFSRSLKDGSRPLEYSTVQDLVSPCDSRIVKQGIIQDDRVDQVKGASYNLPFFLGVDPRRALSSPSSVLHYAVLYLCPADYHRFHSPAAWQVQEVSHFPGEVFPVAPTFLSWFDDVLAVNERMVLSGSTSRGLLYLAPVAAYNVGQIKVSLDLPIRTNSPEDIPVYLGGDVQSHGFRQQVSLQPGDEVGFFKMGSTVVLIFEVPPHESFEWNYPEGAKIKQGQLLGQFS